MSIVAIIFTVLLVISGIGLIIFVLLHSGKGTGLSDMIASQIYNNQTGTGTVEKNLDRITIILAAVFLISLIVLMVVYPHGSIGGN
ncbi:MAG: preprotein translocase subunit SecG [Eggerthellaceae bacterium]